MMLLELNGDADTDADADKDDLARTFIFEHLIDSGFWGSKES